MFFTITLCKQFKFPNGNIWRGKYRLVRKVTQLDLSQVKRELDTERRNMFYLRNPFLAAKEVKALPYSQRKVEKMCVEKEMDKRYEKFIKLQESRKIDVFLKGTLGKTERWD